MINLLKSFEQHQKYKLSALQNFLNQSKISKNQPSVSQSNLKQNNKQLEIKKSLMHKQNHGDRNSKCKCQYHKRVREKFFQIKSNRKQTFKENQIKEYKCKMAKLIKFENKILLEDLQEKKRDELAAMKLKIKNSNLNHLKKINNIKILNLHRRNFYKTKYFDKHDIKKSKIDYYNYQYQKSIQHRNINNQAQISSSGSENKVSKLEEFMKVCDAKYLPIIKYLIKLGYECQSYYTLNSILKFFEQSYKKYDKKSDKFKFYNKLKNQCFLQFKLEQMDISKLILAWNKISNLQQPIHKKLQETQKIKRQYSLLNSKLSSIQHKKSEASHSILSSSVSRRSSKFFQLYSLKEFIQLQEDKIHQFAHAQKEDILFGLQHIQNQLKQEYQKSKNTKMVPQYIIELKTSSFVERVLKKIECSQFLSQLQIHQRSEMLHDGLKLIHHYEDQMINLDHNIYEEQLSYIGKKKSNKKSILKLDNQILQNSYLEDLSSKSQKKGKKKSDEEKEDPQYEPKRIISNIIIKKQKKRLKEQQIYRPKIEEMIPQEEIEEDQQKELQQKFLKNRIRKRREAKIKLQTAITSQQDLDQQQIQAKKIKYSPRPSVNSQVKPDLNEKYKSPLVKIYHLKLNVILSQINEKLIDKNLIQFKINEQDNNFIRRRKIKRLKKFLQVNPEYSDPQLLRNINLYQEHDMMTKYAKYDNLDQICYINSNGDDKMLLSYIINAVQANQNNVIKLGPELKEVEYISSSENLSESDEQQQEKIIKNKQELKIKSEKTQWSQKQMNRNEENLMYQAKYHKYKTLYNNKQNEDDLIQKDLDYKYKIQQLFLPSFNKIPKPQKIHVKNNPINTKKSKIKQILLMQKQKRPELFNTLINFNFRI